MTIDTEVLKDVLNGKRLLSRAELKDLIGEVLASRTLLKEPDWTDSETGLLELWKNPHIPMRDRLLMADGGYHFLRMSHKKVCRLLESASRPSGDWTACAEHEPVPGVRYWLSTTSLGVVIGSLGSRARCLHAYWVTDTGVQLSHFEVSHFMEYTKPTPPTLVPRNSVA